MERRCVVDTSAMVCADGPVVTAGAAFAQTDLMLHLLRERCGARLVDLLARTLLLDGRQAQAKFIAPELLANGDAFALVHGVKVRRAQALLQSTHLSVDDVAAEVGDQDAGTLRRLLKKLGGGSPRALRSAR